MIYPLTYVFYTGLVAVVYGFGIYSLTERGYTSAQAGICLALANILSFILQPILSNIADNSKRINSFGMSLITTFVVIIFSICNMFANKNSIWLTLIFIISVAFYTATEVFINSFSSLFQIANIKINFSLIRSCGSLSYSILCFILGKLTVLYSYPSVNIMMVILSLGLFFVILALKNGFKDYDLNIVNHSNNENISYKEFVVNNKSFMITIFFYMLIFFAYMCFDNFMLLATEYIGGNSGDMGSIQSFKAIAEMFGMIVLFPYLTKKFKLENILKISSLAYIVKIAIQTFSNSLAMMYFAQIFQAFSFAFMLPGMILYINKTIDKKAITRGQALATMASTLGSILSSLAAGTIADSLGVKAMEYVSLITIIVGSLGFILSLNKHAK